MNTLRSSASSSVNAPAIFAEPPSITCFRRLTSTSCARTRLSVSLVMRKNLGIGHRLRWQLSF